MAPSANDLLEGKTPSELIGLVRQLVGEVARLRGETEKLSQALAAQRLENQALKDELARLKNLPPRPPQKPSGMDKATDRPGVEGEGVQGRAIDRSGAAKYSSTSSTVTRTVLSVEAPTGLRRKGFEDIVVQDVVCTPTTRYRRERWETPDGKRWLRRSIPGSSGARARSLFVWS